MLPPTKHNQLDDGSVFGGWWHRETDRIVCDLCPRACSMKPGDRGFCFVRENRDGQMVLSTYGKSTGFCVDPIEKKPLNHFYPGTSVLSFGTAGCNLACKFCQNWSISKSREVERLSEHASPMTIASAAQQLGCHSVAYTYNDPIIWAEYAIDTANECRQLGIKNVAVTAGYITPEARSTFFHAMDAANVDLKAFTEEFYQQLTLSHLQPILDTLVWLKKETDVWFEITNLVIPAANDSLDEFHRMCDWILENLGPDVPLHFTAFHPDFRLQDRHATPLESLLQAYDIATSRGIRHVYVGNVNDVAHQSTYCPQCKQLLIERNWHQLGQYNLDENRCRFCQHQIAGHFLSQPGNWGRKRLPVRIQDFAAPSQAATNQSATIQRTPGDQAVSTEVDVTPPQLTVSQHKAILTAASELVTCAVLNQPARLSDVTIGGAASTPIFGCFVSIKRKGNLRGCCGFLGQKATIKEGMEYSAAKSATGDVRMPRVSPSELAHLEFEVWLLFGQEEVAEQGAQRVNAVTIGKHGLRIQKGNHAGLLLPGVATDLGLNSEQFLDQVCIKAGLPPSAWRDADTKLIRFQGLAVEGDFDSTVLDQVRTESPTVINSNEIPALVKFCRDNMMAVVTGATPSYYAFGCSDGAVHGIALRTQVAGRPDPIQMAQFNTQKPFPLQSTLCQAAQSMGQVLHQEGMRGAAADQLSVELAVLSDPALHGSSLQPDLAGFNPQQRAILVQQGSHSALLMDHSATAEALLAEAILAAKIDPETHASVVSFHIQSNATSWRIINVPRPQSGPAVRSPAVAGTFYPGHPEQMQQALDEMIPTAAVAKEKVSAVMLPHAGWRFSGRLAADVLRRIEIPENVIIIGPKHTAMGVDWAVAPNETWALPGVEIASNVELAKALCQAIPDLELDALAHQREHGIEVELPILHRFAPHAKVVGIAIGSGSLRRCQEFGTGLAAVLQDQWEKTLLIISSDMNHYATDHENRRLDEMALAAIETLDPERVFQTVRTNHISMCGVLPAVMVMHALKQLGQLHSIQRIGYATSADVTGDTSRVVGYAGLLFR
ncbi:MAG: AmmeMemoRadiSam system radical SAM enzyme [Pirellulaceae bacterium]